VAGGAFVRPPGWWHSHHNESDEDAIVLPVLDAGLHTYMQTLDIQFAHGY
jgi:gentisate 1,2-dioxygenase